VRARVAGRGLAALAGGALAWFLSAAVPAEDVRGRHVTYPAVVPGHVLEFPRDFGAHPEFRTEWWYVTGWLESTEGETFGFQVTFFRTRPDAPQDNPSAFAPASSSSRMRRCPIRRVAASGTSSGSRARAGPRRRCRGRPTDVWLDQWRLEREAAATGRGSRARASASSWTLERPSRRC
jgi:predicted secreted hydrolase